jgi:hypothetical protein
METRVRSDLEGNHVRCLEALRPSGDIEFNRLPFAERPIPISLNCGEVYKNVFTGLALNESKSLAGLERPQLNAKKGLRVVFDPQPLLTNLGFTRATNTHRTH